MQHGNQRLNLLQQGNASAFNAIYFQKLLLCTKKIPQKYYIRSEILQFTPFALFNKASPHHLSRPALK